jgi:hypothetical protein
MEPAVGFEPTTTRLQIESSTVEAKLAYHLREGRQDTNPALSGKFYRFFF